MSFLRKHRWALFAFVVAVLLARHVWPREQALVLRDKTGRTLYSCPMDDGSFFSIVFTHSVAKSPVEEVFEVTGRNEFRLRETLYADFGAGLPHEELPGQRMEFANGRIRLSGYDVKFSELYLRVGHVADHRLVVGGANPVHLAELERPGGEVKVSLDEYPLGFRWLM